MDGPKVALNQSSPLAGVTERIRLGVVILCIEVLSVALLRGQTGRHHIPTR